MEGQTGGETAPVLPPLYKRVVAVFVSPGELFDALRERPAWFGALALGALVSMGATLAIPAELFQEMVREQVIQRGGDPSNVGLAAGFARWFGVGGAFLGWWIWAFILSGILTLIFSFILGDEGRYKQYLSFASHALLIAALGVIVTLPLRISQGDIRMTLSIGTFFTFLEEGYPLRVLRLLDLFGLWSSVVLALGVSRLDPKRSWGSAIGILMGLALVFAMIFGVFGGAAG